MQNKENTYKGYVTRVEPERQFGFIETENGCTYFFAIDNKGERKRKQLGLMDKIHKFCSGDEVEFQVRTTRKDKNKIEAYSLKFIRNERRQKLIDEAILNDSMLGYIKLIDNESFFIKHISTHVFIPLSISAWETDLEEVYNKRIDKLVKFRLIETHQIDKLKAVLTDVRFLPEYYELQSAINNDFILSATITGKNSKGLFAEILNGRIEGFIPISKNPKELELMKFEKFRKGSVAKVRVKCLFDNRKASLILAY